MDLPALTVEGNYYEVGYKTGCHFKEEIQKQLGKYILENQPIFQYVEAKEGKKVYDEYLNRANEYYPQFIDQLKGLADGSKIDFKKIFTRNIVYEIRSHLGIVGGDPHCSTVIVNNEKLVAFGHNEDGEAYSKCFILRAKIKNDNLRGKLKISEENVLAICYLDGVGIGNSIVVTKTKELSFIFSINVLYPITKGIPGIPYYLMTRAIAAASSIEDFEKKLKGDECRWGCSFGFSVNVCFLDDQIKIYNYEVAPSNDGVSGSRISKSEITRDLSHYFHFNLYKHLEGSQDTSKVHSISSIYRQKLAETLEPPRDLSDIRSFLSNTDYKEYPVYREPNETDQSATIVTMVADLKKDEIYFYSKKSIASIPRKYKITTMEEL